MEKENAKLENLNNNENLPEIPTYNNETNEFIFTLNKLKVYLNYINDSHSLTEIKLKEQDNISENRSDYLFSKLNEYKAIRQELNSFIYKVKLSEESHKKKEEEINSTSNTNSRANTKTSSIVRLDYEYTKEINNNNIRNDNNITPNNKANFKTNSNKIFINLLEPIAFNQTFFQANSEKILFESHISKIEELNKPIDTIQSNNLSFYTLKIDDFLLFKKVIEYYLKHIIIQNLDLLTQYSNKVSLLLIDSEKALNHVQVIKKKTSFCKEKILNNSLSMLTINNNKTKKKNFINSMITIKNNYERFLEIRHLLENDLYSLFVRLIYQFKINLNKDKNDILDIHDYKNKERIDDVRNKLNEQKQSNSKFEINNKKSSCINTNTTNNASILNFILDEEENDYKNFEYNYNNTRYCFNGKEKYANRINILDKIENECLEKEAIASETIKRSFEGLFINKKELYVEMFCYEIIKSQQEHNYDYYPDNDIKEKMDLKDIKDRINFFELNYQDKLINVFSNNIIKTVSEILLVYANNKQNVSF